MIKLYTSVRSRFSDFVKNYFDRIGLDFEEIGIETNPDAIKIVEEAPPFRTPVLVYKDKVLARGPMPFIERYSKEELLEKLEFFYKLDRPLR